MFNSPIKNDILQKHIKEHFEREIQLMIDVNTRWNSLFFILQRLYKVKNCILKSLIYVGSIVSFDEYKLNLICYLIEKELLNFEIEGKWGQNHERCYQNLNVIPPANVEFKLVFSGFAKIANKIRSTLNDKSLDILTFLRSYFKSENLKLE